MNGIRCRWMALLLCVLTGPAVADSGNPLPATDDQWRFTIAFPMIWAPDIEGKIRGADPVDFRIGFNQIIDRLSFGFMGEVYANRGPWGFAFRTMYMNVEDESSRSGLFETRVRTDMVMGVNDLLASYEVHDNIRLTGGLRHVFAKLELDLFSTIGDREVLNETIVVTDDNQLDYVVGTNLSHWFNERWGVMLNADIALAGDNDRNQSAEFRALYRFGRLNNLWFGYRYLGIGNDVDDGDGSYSVDMTQHGPTIGWAFTF